MGSSPAVTLGIPIVENSIPFYGTSANDISCPNGRVALAVSQPAHSAQDGDEYSAASPQISRALNFSCSDSLKS